MNVIPVRNPLAGEQVVAVDPPLAPRVDAGWRRRLNLFTGRSLDASALAAEQRARAARSALLARALTPGIVAGLEAGLTGTTLSNAMLDLGPGLGVTAWGEDVRLARALKVPLDLLQVAASTGGGAGPTLRELIAGGAAPRALILVLQPVLVEEIGAADPLDPCERDPQSEAFEDQRTADACRPLLVTWPSSRIDLPLPGPRWRNRLAWAIFDEALGGQPLPWEEIGVPIALIGSYSEAGVLFLDRSSVARIGGRPRSRTPLLPAAGDPSLWQARTQQFAEHLTDLLALPGATMASAAGHFERLPPAGLLPRQAASFTPPILGEGDQDAGDQSLFTHQFLVGAAPIPVDELEPLFEASASLAPFDLTNPDIEQVQLLVPVPGALYDPRLLVRERVDPEFEETLEGFRTTRDRWLWRRQDVREKFNTLLKSLSGGGTKLPFPFVDPDAQKGETPQPPVKGEPLEDDFGTFHGVADTDTKISVLRKLRNLFRSTGPFAPLGREWDRQLIEGEGLEGLIRTLSIKISRANDKIDFGFLQLQTEIYRVRQIVLGNVAGTRLATSPVLAEVAKGESAPVTREILAKVFEAGRPDGSQESFTGFPVEEAAEAFALERVSFASGEELTRKLDLGSFQITDTLTATSTVTAKDSLLSSSLLGAATLSTASATGTVTRQPVATLDPVRDQSPIPGVAVDFRNLSVAERLRVPPARQAMDYALAVMIQVLNGLEALGIVVDDLEVPLYTTKIQNNIQVRVRQDEAYSLVRPAMLTKVLGQPQSTAADEAGILGDAVSFQETASVFLRRLEGRVRLYQSALDRCREAATEVRRLIAAAQQRLGEIDRELMEARHDVTVTLALIKEEEKRVQAINLRRGEILNNHVPFLAWHRPRVVDTLADGPVRSLDPPLAEDPVPAVLARPAHPPLELRRMVELLRDAPLRWFRKLPVLLDQLDRLDVLQDMLRLAKSRAGLVLAQPLLAEAVQPSPSPAATGASRAFAAQRQTLTETRIEVARLDLSIVQQQSWKSAAALARQVLSVGDLLEIAHGRAEVARLGSRELDDILRVATAVWAGFGDVLPALRLDWVERLSQFDEPVDLRRLDRLPRWDEIEIEERRSLQALVDWLFQRIDTNIPQAVALMNSVVRVCVLLASHAPVDRLIAGKVAEDTPIRLGGIVPLVVEISRVRIGMPVILYAQDSVAARAVVEDLGGGRAYARVLDAAPDLSTVAKDARAEFTEAPVLG